MKNTSFEEIQKNMQLMFSEVDVKVGTKKARLLEYVYVRALRDAEVEVPTVIDIYLMTNRSIAGYGITNKKSRPAKVDIGIRAQLGFDDSDESYADGYKL
jgi:hypothetical protein